MKVLGLLASSVFANTATFTGTTTLGQLPPNANCLTAQSDTQVLVSCQDENLLLNKDLQDVRGTSI
jgi:hypothetical protein